MCTPTEQTLEWMEEGRLSANPDSTITLEPMLREGRSRTGCAEYDGASQEAGAAIVGGGFAAEKAVSAGRALKAGIKEGSDASGSFAPNERSH